MNDMTTTDAGPLIVLPSTGPDLDKLFREPAGLDGLVSEIEKRCMAEVFDYGTAAGRKDARSLAYRVAQSKSAIDNKGKELNADMAAAIAKVNTNKKVAIDRLQALQDKIKKPAEDWDAAEKARKDALLLRVQGIASTRLSIKSTADDLEHRMTELRALVIDDSWEEFRDAAMDRRREELERLGAYLEVARQREENERQRLENERKAAEDRAAAEAEAEAQRKRDAEVQALRLEEERKARAEAEEREAAERARVKKLEDELAEMKLKQEAEERATREQKERADRLEREKAEAERQAELERQQAEERAAAAKRAEAEAEAIKVEKAATAESQDMLAGLRAETDAIFASVTEIVALTRIDKATASVIVDAVIRGDIPHMLWKVA